MYFKLTLELDHFLIFLFHFYMLLENENQLKLTQQRLKTQQNNANLSLLEPKQNVNNVLQL